MSTRNTFSRAALATAQAASLLLLATGLVVLSGWWLHVPHLTRLFATGPNVKTNAAVALSFGALSTLLIVRSERRPRLARVARWIGALPLVIGSLTLLEHVVGWNLGMDQLLASEPAGAFATLSPNRMGPPASLAFTLIGLALVLSDPGPRWRAARQALALTTSVIAIVPLTGYMYGFSGLYAVAGYTGIALATAIGLLGLSIAVLAARPEEGLVALLCRDDEIGTLTRTLLTPALLLPLGAGWLLARAVDARMLDGALALSIMAVLLVVGSTALIWRTGIQLARALDARLAVQEALRERERSLREADRKKTEFLATLSHELRNPLAPIRFALELLNGPPSAAERARQTIARQVKYLVHLIDDLLDLTRINRNKLQLQMRQVELSHVVNDAVDAVRNEIVEAGHRLELQVPEAPIHVCADPDRLVQILVNLLTNAARYTPPGGVITVGADAEGEELEVFVRDTGAGLAAADLDRVFEMFVQVGENTHGGLGIGLSLVRGLVELHGGTVRAQSEGPGTGSQFTIHLPCTRPVSASLEPAAPVLSRLPPRRILVVDDNMDAADMLHDVLASSGHEVQVAYDGPGALDLAASFRPEVALLDIGMSGMNGHELASRLRRDPATAATLLIAVTGWGQDEDRRRAMEAGFDAHLTKPADPEAILAVIAQHLSQPASSGRG